AENGRRRGDNALLLALASGQTVRDAARLAGIGERTATRRLADPAYRRRVAELRAEIERQERETFQAERMAMAQRHVREAQEFQAKALERLRKLIPEDLKPREVLDYWIQGAKVERVSLGEPEQEAERKADIDVKVTIAQLQPMIQGATDAELDQLLAQLM